MKSNPPVKSLAVISLVTLAGAVWLYIKGPIPVIRGTTALDKIVPFWYMITAFPVLGILIAEFLTKLLKSKFDKHVIIFFIQIFILIIISNIRLSLLIPISGHAFLFAFFISHRIFARDYKSLFSKAELAVTTILLLIITYIKLVWWTDPLTLSVGIVAGLVLAIPTLIFKQGDTSPAASSPRT